MSKDIQRALNIQLGLASDDETPELGGDVEAVAETAAVAEGAVEVADATDEVVEADQTVDELSEAHENLEEVSEALEEAAANGGISQESARFAHLAIKAACGRFYSPAIASALPSVESFTGSSSRQRNTTIALESVGTMLRSFWDAIVRQIKKLWATVKNWYLKVLDAAPRLKKKAESLAKRSSDITGSAEEKTVNLGVMNQLHLNGKAPDITGTKKLIGELSKAAENILGSKTSGTYDGIFDDYEDLLDKVTNLDDGKFKSIKTVAEFYALDVNKSVDKSIGMKAETVVAGAQSSIGKSGVVDGGAKRFGDDLDVTGSQELFGGRQVIYMEPKKSVIDTGTLVRHIRSTGMRFVDFKQKGKDIDGSGDFKTLSSADIRSICDEIADICDHVVTYKKSWEARDKQFNKMDSAAKKAVANVEKDKEANSVRVKVVKDVAMGMSAAYQLGIRFETQFINYLLAVGRSLIVWVERSIAQYK